MHKRQGEKRARALMDRAVKWIIRCLTDAERREHDAYCAQLEALIAARTVEYRYAF